MDDLRSLAHDLSEAPRRAQRDAVAVVEHAALNVKNGWRDNAKQSSGKYAPSYPASISYDLSLTAAVIGRIEAEVGPDKSKRQGALGNLLEFGSANNPPHNDGGRALRDEAPKFEAELAKVTLDALGWH
ncbi:MAG TPA: hypothetical protein VN088_08515 [Nocardioides sp.]|nr:hypothetical protein [Nocardioides sp.]